MGLDEPRLAQVVDQRCVDELVLGHSLHHQHPLLAKVAQHLHNNQTLTSECCDCEAGAHLWYVNVNVVVCTVEKDVRQNSHTCPPNTLKGTESHISLYVSEAGYAKVGF